MPDETKPAPSHLSPRSQALWNTLVLSYFGDGKLVRLQLALEALDRADQAKARIDKEGLTIFTPGTRTAHAHPLLKIERESRQEAAKLIEQFSFDRLTAASCSTSIESLVFSDESMKALMRDLPKVE